MGVDVTPSGTRGFRMPRFPPLVRRAINGLLNLRVRLRGGHLLRLTTIGAKSGNPHMVPLSWFPDEGNWENVWLIVASNGGAAKHPTWYINLATHPDRVWIDLGAGKIQVHPESLKGSERERTWQRIVSEVPNYGHYQQLTDREIPVVRLTRAE